MILRTPKTTKRPTPTPIMPISKSSSTPIWLAVTLRSGSAIVTRTPMMKVMATTKKIFLFLKRDSPMIFPIADIEASAPMLKSERPMTINTEQMRKEI